MKTFWKSCGLCLSAVLISELLCLILAFSFAIIRNSGWLQIVSLICGVLAHILLMGSAAQKAAQADALLYRREGIRIHTVQPVLTALVGILPFSVIYLLLCMKPQSIVMLNLFPLLQSPFIQIHRLLIAGTEPFAAIPSGRKIIMALPPLITGISWLIGYQMHYIRAAAAADAGKTASHA